MELAGLLRAHCGLYLPGWSAPASANQWSLRQEVHREKRKPSMVNEQRGTCFQARQVIGRTPVVSLGLSQSPSWHARSARVVLSEGPSNHAIERSAQQRCCARCWVPSSLRSSAPAHCKRWASTDAISHQPESFG
jgi:hypothetical protein